MADFGGDEEDSHESDEFHDLLRGNKTADKRLANPGNVQGPFNYMEFYKIFLKYLKFEARNEENVLVELTDSSPSNFEGHENTDTKRSFCFGASQGFSGEISKEMNLEAGFHDKSDDGDSILDNKASQHQHEIVVVQDEGTFIKEVIQTEDG